MSRCSLPSKSEAKLVIDVHVVQMDALKVHVRLWQFYCTVACAWREAGSWLEDLGALFFA